MWVKLPGFEPTEMKCVYGQTSAETLCICLGDAVRKVCFTIFDKIHGNWD